MNKKNTILFGMRIGCAVCAFVAEVLQICAILFQYDSGTNYFKKGAILPSIAVGLVVLAVILGIISAIITDKSTLSSPIFSKKATLNPASIGFAASAVCMIIALATGRAESSNWTTLILIFSLVSVFYTVAIDLPSLRKSTAAVAFSGFFAVFSCIFLIAYYYFDLSVEMNAPLKIVTQMGLLSAIIYLVTEIRFLIGNALPRLFLALSFALVSIGALSSLAVPIALIAGKTDRIDYLAGAILTLCLSISAVIRIYRLLIPSVKGQITVPKGKESK